MKTPTEPLRMKSLGRLERRGVSLSDGELVQFSPMEPAGLPLVLQPAVPGVDLTSWARSHRERIDELLLQHRALLFRGFGVKSADELHDFVAASSSGDLLQYRDRSTPRYEVGEKVYVSTIYPAAERIRPHNEGTYWMAWPLRIYFCCLQAPQQGGETPICDVRKVYQRIDPEIRKTFERKRIMYVRNYNQGIGLTWQEAYQATDRAEVEEYGRANRIEIEWRQDERLRTRQIRPAVRKHPVTGESLWFNHGAFFHISSQEPAVRAELQASFTEEDLPYNTYYGDGTPIEDEVIAHIREAYDREKVIFPWLPGDVLILDNMTVAHAREPYAGERKVIVAMVDQQTGEQA
ncbi:MAG TPA: TauD/TfdA family dioxygenase [Thermoanaerobaculia bacterium]|nr:TauD/TfdA family dioxygenase [Thermoanaerobaculia bacterium]